MKTHAQKRLKERYNQACTTALQRALIKRIHDGRARVAKYFDVTTIPEEHKHRCKVTVLYNKKLYKFIFNEKTNKIVTFLPI